MAKSNNCANKYFLSLLIGIPCLINGTEIAFFNDYRRSHNVKDLNIIKLKKR